jgi:hypothetical protein
MAEVDVARYHRRTAEERALAATAPSPQLAQAHFDLAEKYEAVAAAYSNIGRRRPKAAQDT